ncbi:putative AdoMet-dependent methyltransferase [Bacillus pakistanensis]|uniref:Uncharacterized methyltransferase JOC86_001307 n=1 Tax=Rossellomorea pakistanensis TaxID=992288 RepID=A0ABS2NAB8_9BACI|nr:class I SAM-dependent methyltransferase [Bacillus pakistanensis]MBM7584770.1 putative AdoMet-dependent methyltransferase [Bacillus pakistanensis]
MGREFLDLFQDWADSYDDTVTGKDIEYKEVFAKYEEILDTVVKKSEGTVLEFGPGTGNLTKKLLEANHKVIAVEPSKEMMAIAKQKLTGNVELLDGDFLEYSINDTEIDTIVSTYAFHHLTDDEKAIAFLRYGNLLSNGGKIVFADTIFETQEAHEKSIQEAVAKGYHNLAEDLQREYYTTIPVLDELLQKNGFTVSFKRLNEFVWLLVATKQ